MTENYYLGMLRFIVTIKTAKGDERINSEMFQLVKAENKQKAREGLVSYFNNTSNGATLLEARINDTIDSEGKETT